MARSNAVIIKRKFHRRAIFQFGLTQERVKIDARTRNEHPCVLSLQEIILHVGGQRLDIVMFFPHKWQVVIP